MVPWHRTRAIALCVGLLGSWVASAAPAGAIDCLSFALPAEAQAVLDGLPSDPYWLDQDKNGVACDDVPPAAEILAAASTAVAQAPSSSTATTDTTAGPPADILANPETVYATEIDKLGVTLSWNDNPGGRTRVVHVRLIGIDVPKRQGLEMQLRPGYPGDECFSAEAEARLRELLPVERPFWVEYDVDETPAPTTSRMCGSKTMPGSIKWSTSCWCKRDTPSSPIPPRTKR